MTDQISAALQVLENGVSRQQQAEALRQLLATRLVTPIYKPYVFHCLICNGDTHYQVEVRGWDFPCCREHRGGESLPETDLSQKTPEQLLDMCQPYLAKLLARIPLSEQEETEHQALIAEARRQHDALRASELADRAARFA